MTTKVVNKFHQEYDVDITRGTKYGNPFIIGVDGTRSEVIEMFRMYALTAFTEDDILYLQNKRLGCVCFPKKCHGDVLVDMVDSLTSPLMKGNNE